MLFGECCRLQGVDGGMWDGWLPPFSLTPQAPQAAQGGHHDNLYELLAFRLQEAVTLGSSRESQARLVAMPGQMDARLNADF